MQCEDKHFSWVADRPTGVLLSQVIARELLHLIYTMHHPNASLVNNSYDLRLFEKIRGYQADDTENFNYEN